MTSLTWKVSWGSLSDISMAGQIVNFPVRPLQDAHRNSLSWGLILAFSLKSSIKQTSVCNSEILFTHICPYCTECTHRHFLQLPCHLCKSWLLGSMGLCFCIYHLFGMSNFIKFITRWLSENIYIMYSQYE